MAAILNFKNVNIWSRDYITEFTNVQQIYHCSVLTKK